MRIDGIDANVWVMLGDSEMAEGSVWEAMEATSFHGAGNVTAILDLNRLGQRGETMHGWNADVFRDRAEAFGWSAIQIDGHDVDADRPRVSQRAGRRATDADRGPHGEGPRGVVPREPGELARQGGARRSTRRSARRARRRPCGSGAPRRGRRSSTRPRSGARARRARPTYDGPIATRKAFGDALAWLAGTYDDVVVLDGEVGNSTHTEEAEAVAPERFFQLYIAEQCMVGVQTGLQALGKTAFAATFGAFLTRAADSDPDGRDQPGRPAAVRLARRRVDR